MSVEQPPETDELLAADALTHVVVSSSKHATKKHVPDPNSDAPEPLCRTASTDREWVGSDPQHAIFYDRCEECDWRRSAIPDEVIRDA